MPSERHGIHGSASRSHATAATKKTSSKTTSVAAKGPVDKALEAKWEKAIDQYRAARDAETSGWG